MVNVFDLGSNFYRFKSCYPYMSSYNKINNNKTVRNKLNNTLQFLTAYNKLPFPTKTPLFTPLSKNKYNIIRKYFKIKPNRFISSNKRFLLPSLKSFYSLQGKGRANYALTIANLLRFERQIDIILVRSNLVTSIPQARQLIKNGLVYINGRKLSSYYLLHSGDIITLNSSFPVASSHVLPIPKYLIVNPSTRSIIFTKFNILDIPLSFQFFHKFLLDLL
jgi:ribosomal protein S4